MDTPSDLLPDANPLQLLTPQEVADLLKVSKPKVYAMAQDGRLPAVRIGSNVRFMQADLLAYLNSARATGA